MRIVEVDALIDLCKRQNISLPHSIVLTGKQFKEVERSLTSRSHSTEPDTRWITDKIKYRGLTIINQAYLDAVQYVFNLPSGV